MRGCGVMSTSTFPKPELSLMRFLGGTKWSFNQRTTFSDGSTIFFEWEKGWARVRPRRRVVIKTRRGGSGEGARWVRTRKRGHINDDVSSCRRCRENEARRTGGRLGERDLVDVTSLSWRRPAVVVSVVSPSLHRHCVRREVEEEEGPGRVAQGEALRARPPRRCRCCVKRQWGCGQGDWRVSFDTEVTG